MKRTDKTNNFTERYAMSLKAFTDIQLLAELISRNKFDLAATKTQRHGVHYESIVAIGKDNTAFITLTDDGMKELVNINGEIK